MTAFISESGKWQIEQYQSNLMLDCGSKRYCLSIYKDGFWQSYRNEISFNDALLFLKERRYISEDEYLRNLNIRQ
jgi:hypothetical protein